jgi:hypothetical protein
LVEQPKLQDVPEFPITMDDETTKQPLAKELVEELHRSWEKHGLLPTRSYESPKNLFQVVQHHRKSCKTKLDELEKWIEHALWKRLPRDQDSQLVHQLRQAHGSIRHVRWRDMLIIAAASSADPTKVVHLYNPSLNRTACQTVVQVARRYLKVAVLDDKLQRITNFL